MTTTYPGVGADQAIADLHQAVGDATSRWADIEDGLFTLFVVALTGKWLVGDARPYQAVFFEFKNYGPQMRMVNAAMKTRHRDNDVLISEWRELKKRLDTAAQDRNQLAHLSASVNGTTDPDAPAIARLRRPFWKSMPSAIAPEVFEPIELSLHDVKEQLNSWGSLGYDLQQFTNKLMPEKSPPSTP